MEMALCEETDLLGKQLDLMIVISDQRIGGAEFLAGGFKLGLE